MNPAVAYVAAAGVILGRQCQFRGLSIRDTSGSANTVNLYNNATAASGTIVATVELPANGSGHVAAHAGVFCSAGLFLEADGALTGSVWIG